MIDSRSHSRLSARNPVWPALALACLGTKLTATDYYLGSNAAQQPGVPVASLADASGLNLEPGDRVLLQGGQTFTGTLWLLAEDSGTAAQPVIITSYGSGRATLQNGEGHAIGIHNAGGIVVRNLELDGRDHRTNPGAGVWVRSERADSGKFTFLQLEDLRITRFRDGVELGAWPTGGAAVWPGYADVALRRLEVFGNRNDGISVWGAWHEGRTGQYSHRNVTISDSTVYENRGDPDEDKQTGSGIVLGGVDGGVVERCVVHHNGGFGPATGGGPYGIWVWESRRVTIERNLVHHQDSSSDQDGGAYDLDGGATECLVQYNVSYQNAGPALALIQFAGASAHTGNVVRYNLSEDDARQNPAQGVLCLGPWPGGAPITGAQVHGNTLVAGATADGARPPLVYVAREGPISGVHLRNNLFRANHWGAVVTDAAASTGRVLYQGNNYTGGSFDLAAFRAAGQETLAGVAVGRRQSPRWAATGPLTVTTAAGRSDLTAYRLKPDSPLLRAGVALAPLGVDPGPHDFYRHRLPDGPPAIGADATGPAGTRVAEASAAVPSADPGEPEGTQPEPAPIATTTTTVASTTQAATAAAPAAVRINAGGPAYTDEAGNRWSADTGYNTGRTYAASSSVAIAGTKADPLYRTERYDPSASAPNLRYSVPVPNGTYRLRLHFAENHSPSMKAGARVFDVRAESALVLDNFDIFRAAGGGRRAVIRDATVTVADGRFDLEFLRVRQNPKINAIALLPTGAAADTTPPTVPGNVRASAVSSTSIGLTWSGSTDNVGVTAYDVKRNGTVVGSVAGTKTSFTDAGRTASTSYQYQIVARDAAGNTAASAILKATTLAAAPTTARLTLAWNDNSANETGFKIERSRDGVSFTQIATVGANVTTYTDSGLTVGVPYWYRVRAYNATGNSGYSNTTSATTTVAAVGAGGAPGGNETVVDLVPRTGLAASFVSDGKPDRRGLRLPAVPPPSLYAEDAGAVAPERPEQVVAE